MSWSTAANGTWGILVEEQRVGLVFEVGLEGPVEIDRDLVTSLYSLNFRHFIFRVKMDSKLRDIAVVISNLVQYLRLLGTLSKTRNVLQDAALYTTLVWDIADVEAVRVCFSSISTEENAAIDCLLVDLAPQLNGSELSSFSSSTYTENIAKVPELSRLLIEIRNCAQSCRQTGAKPLTMGIDGIYECGILQLLFEQPVGKYLQLVLPGSLQLPNIQFRLIDYIHSHGANTMHMPTADVLSNWAKTEDQAPVLYPLIKKYPQCKNQAAPIIVKYLLQLGIIVGVPASLGRHFIEELIAPTIHPFVNRKEYVAPSITKRFVLDYQDVENMVVESEQVELKIDDALRAFLLKNPYRILSDKLL